MFQLKNHTPFAADIAVFPNEQGIDTLYTLVKATFIFFPKLALAPEQAEPQKKDEYSGEIGHSSLLVASDYHTGKAGTDIVMTGTAFSRDAQEVRQLDVSLQVADLHKVVKVFGDRVWDHGRMTQAQPFTQMPLTYERAFGGVLLVDGKLHQQEERNPVGMGFSGDLTETEVETWPLPNLENPAQLIQQFGMRPSPACFAPVAPHWYPRATFAGTYDDHWQYSRAPYLPENFDPRFNNCAPDGQIYPGFLVGGEPVFITGMHPMGEQTFKLPRINMVNHIHLQAHEVAAPFTLETIHLQPNQQQVSMVWRSAYICDKHTRKIRQISVNMIR
jgi:hypothetical protein